MPRVGTVGYFCSASLSQVILEAAEILGFSMRRLIVVLPAPLAP
ncbi:Unknown protein sequence [Pseudomonas amygdali pv. lachrymans]|uniref:Uncharacterized protein n=1 Tax=Pseudomonas amygdali pv. lachrymans TaxID=53707 RepID=A0ABR5KIW8_PSEAV|nr:Unknown protein sequence [Pseudomonas amygdali pv. lachrymans]